MGKFRMCVFVGANIWSETAVLGCFVQLLAFSKLYKIELYFDHLNKERCSYI